MKQQPKNKGNKFERIAQRNINSGAMWFNKGDLSTDDYCIECKYTEKKGFRITLDTIKKIWNEAFDCNKEPLLKIGIKRDDKTLFMLTCSIEIERL